MNIEEESKPTDTTQKLKYTFEEVAEVLKVTPNMARDLMKIAVQELDYQEKKEKGYYEHDELHTALMYAEDILGRSVMPFSLLSELADQIRKDQLPKLFGNGVHIGVLRKNYTRSSASILEMLLKNDHVNATYSDNVQGTKIEFDYKGVPVSIYIFNEQYPFLLNPDKAIYTTTEFYLPNPFEDYWKVREDIIW